MIKSNNILLANKEYIKLPFSKKKIFFLLLYYFLGFTFLFPYVLIEVFQLLSIMEYLTPLTYQFYMYAIFVLPLIFWMRPLLFAERSFSIRKMIVTSFVSILILLYANVAFNMLTNFFLGNQQSENQSAINSIAYENVYLLAFITCVLGPVMEELIFRGVLFRCLRERKSFVFSCLISSFFFGLIHVLSAILDANYADLWFLILYMGLGCIFCYMYESNRSIYPCIFAHMVYNFMGSIHLFL